MNIRFLFFPLLAVASSLNAQVRVTSIAPGETGAGISEVHGPHIAVDDPAVKGRRELVLMIQGTGGRAQGCRRFDSCIAEMGYHVISIDYPNSVVTTVCSDSPDSACFDGFRQEILFGTPVSEKVTVDSVNCIVNRFMRVLVWLAEHDRAGGWKAFLRHGRPRWNRIVVMGHSQGAGHAAYLGKRFRVAGVVMLSGPQDYLKAFQRPAGWQGRRGRTLATREFAFLNLRDPYNYTFQVADVAAVTGFARTDTSFVRPGEAVHGHGPIFVNDMETEDHHGSTMDVVFVPVWQFIMDRLSGIKRD